MNKPSSSYRFILSGGGTGGHIYPAIAIANQLKTVFPKAEILFVGANNRMEMQKVPKAGYPIRGLWISGIQRRLTIQNLLFPIKLIYSLWQAKKIIKQFSPQVVIGTGGYASAPLLRVASKKGIPCVIQEQNSYAGIANKWLAKRAQKICVAYPGMEHYFPKEKIVFTGNPVRQDIVMNSAKRTEAQQFFNLDAQKKTLLVLGGSLGARTINELVEKSLPLFQEQQVQVLWQTGALYFDRFKKHQQEGVFIHDFIYAMDLAYNIADLIISRAGALSVSELYIVGKPVIFIPSPNVAEDHQKKNAEAVLQQNAALMIEEKDLESRFEKEFLTLINDPETQQRLGKNIQRLARPQATEEIVEEIIKLVKPTP